MKKNEIMIEDARYSDYDDFLSLFSIVETLHRNKLPWKYQKPDILFTEQEFSELLKQHTTKISIAKYHGKSIGLILAFHKESPPKPVLKKRTYIEIDTICVLDEFRNLGVGTNLLKAVENWGIEKNISDVQLNVRSFNDEARLFYLKNGYEVTNSFMRKVL